MKPVFVLSLAFLMTIAACKKDKNPTPNPPPVSDADKIKDTALQIARDIYLWYDQIPANFDPRTFGDPNEVMKGIRPFSKEPGFTAAVDRWSFGILQKDWDNVSGGISGDLGLGIFFMNSSDLRVSYVEKESVSGKAGVQRSWKITKINGHTDINTTDASINFIVDAMYGGKPASISFVKPDGSSVDLSLTPSTYKETPVILDTVYTSGGHTIGYFVLNSFLGDTTEIRNSFNTVFSKFAAKNVSELIVDLRYNGGGYVSLQEELANYLAPNSLNGSLMYSQSYNNKYSEFNRTKNFSKKGSLNPSKIVFIVTKNTASASEALINIMKPHIAVKVVGPGPSHGKPVGFFDIPVGEWYVFPVSLRLVNSNNEGNYFNGFAPDSKVMDGLDKSWGDLSEDCLASAFTYLTTGSFRLDSRYRLRANEAALSSFGKLSTNKLKIMVESREVIPGIH